MMGQSSFILTKVSSEYCPGSTGREQLLLLPRGKLPARQRERAFCRFQLQDLDDSLVGRAQQLEYDAQELSRGRVVDRDQDVDLQVAIGSAIGEGRG